MNRRYVEAVRAVGPPTDQQIDHFVAHLRRDHSWYKHLPLTGPGEPFLIHLNPTIHQLVVDREDGTCAVRDLIKDPENTSHIRRVVVDLRKGDIEPNDLWVLNHHVKGVATRERREQMGQLSYWNPGPLGIAKDALIEIAAERLRVFLPDGSDSGPLPRGLLAAGLVHLRGTVSPHDPFDDDLALAHAEAATRGEDVIAVEHDRQEQVQQLKDACRWVRQTAFDLIGIGA